VTCSLLAVAVKSSPLPFISTTPRDGICPSSSSAEPVLPPRRRWNCSGLTSGAELPRHRCHAQRGGGSHEAGPSLAPHDGEPSGPPAGVVRGSSDVVLGLEWHTPTGVCQQDCPLLRLTAAASAAKTGTPRLRAQSVRLRSVTSERYSLDL
jgi:hypothetical protein